MELDPAISCLYRTDTKCSIFIYLLTDKSVEKILFSRSVYQIKSNIYLNLLHSTIFIISSCNINNYTKQKYCQKNSIKNYAHVSVFHNYQQDIFSEAVTKNVSGQFLIVVLKVSKGLEKNKRAAGDFNS